MELYLLLLCFATLLPISFSFANDKYNTCSGNFKCGSIDGIGYPFYGGSSRPDYCGYPGFELDCSQDTPKITISNQAYDFKGIGTEAYSIKVSRTDAWKDYCPDSPTNTTIDYSKFDFTSADQNITFLYDCGQNDALSSLYLKPTCEGDGLAYYLTQAMVNQQPTLLHICKHLFLPVLESSAKIIDTYPNNSEYVIKALEAGFELDLTADNDACGSCVKSGGECGHDPDSDSKNFICHCHDADYNNKCKGIKRTATIAISLGIGIVVLGLLILFSIYVLWKCKPLRSLKPVPKNQGVEDLLKNYESRALRRYTYSNIVKITNSFGEKLGEGGYGTVFKGKLQDGRIVAVKVLKESKGNGQEFANEVVSICSTSHINVVPLLGFCFEGHKGALLYEFMPNGSLEKFIRRRDINKNDQTLTFQKLFEIAVGITRGLEYLHQDCNTRIVHFDIKPHNILLDEDFTPKISDFGLAKPFKQKESIITISGARGTAGYIAPEVFFSNYGGASHKSDVYSYGMMVLEMVGCTKRADETVENSSELYFPRWIYKQLEQETTLDDGGSLNDEDKELERKMVLVGLWCIQTNPRSRPSMRRVLGMLEGEVELEVPPMPCFASPPRQQLPTNDGSVSLLSSATHDSSNNLEISTSIF